MLWSTLVNPAMVAASAAAGCTACRVAGVNPHVPAMLLACGVCLIAAEAALVPVLLKPPTLVLLVQATFLGTVLHLGLAGILGLVTLLVLKPGPAFVYWLLAIYWITLIATSVIFVKMVRAKSRETQATLN